MFAEFFYDLLNQNIPYNIEETSLKYKKNFLKRIKEISLKIFINFKTAIKKDNNAWEYDITMLCEAKTFFYWLKYLKKKSPKRNEPQILMNQNLEPLMNHVNIALNVNEKKEKRTILTKIRKLRSRLRSIAFKFNF